MAIPPMRVWITIVVYMKTRIQSSGSSAAHRAP